MILILRRLICYNKLKMWWCYNRKIYDKIDNYLYYMNQRYRDDVIIDKYMIK